MGLVSDMGTTSHDLKNATEAIIREFCTCRVAPPRVSQAKCEAKFDAELYDHITKSVIGLDADGASDEQRALRLLQEALFPNCLLLKDKTHATRRFLSRPWDADVYVKWLLAAFISGPESVCEMIQHSPDIQSMFNRHVNAVKNSFVNGTRIRNLKHAKHRFDSLQKPLQRFLLWLDAMWATAVEVACARKGRDPGKIATTFLDRLNGEEGAEALIQLAMLADAADETMIVTRFFDTENYDVS